MKKELTISILQADLIWENKEQNLAKLESLAYTISDHTDLLVLPEMFNTGFSMNTIELAETMDGQTVFWMKTLAKLKSCVVSGTLIIQENGKFYNRHLWVTQNGKLEYYDKRHLFRLAKEDKYYTAGKERKVVELKGWKINLTTCYDLRFPVWSRNRKDYDIILNAANWPVPRIHAWKTLNQARAIENLCYTIACNRVGSDPKGNQYSGHSAIIDYQGKVLSELVEKEGVISYTIDKEPLDLFREKFAFDQDQDDFTLHL